MSAPSQDVLLDSNAYFRLGNSIRPLLQRSFGPPPPYSLHVLAELDDEYASNFRVRHKFEWVSHAEYRNDRKAKRFELRGEDRTRALNAFSFLLAYADEHEINLSREDLRALAVGFVKDIPVITDDSGMIRVADANGIECWSTIKLLRVLETAGRIDMEKVTEILEYWDYENDLPMPRGRLRQVFRKHFGADCPI
ncbi:MAG: hypothetical protein HS113_25010 [Verrucomicrobiales bacterium]|nr:hypothetical protein [Verrucomicrobiales bacterium]